jgi:hypothetical protein
MDHEGDYDVFFGLEVVVDGSLPNIGRLGNLVHGHVRDAATRK